MSEKTFIEITIVIFIVVTASMVVYNLFRDYNSPEYKNGYEDSIKNRNVTIYTYSEIVCHNKSIFEPSSPNYRYALGYCKGFDDTMNVSKW